MDCNTTLTDIQTFGMTTKFKEWNRKRRRKKLCIKLAGLYAKEAAIASAINNCEYPRFYFSDWESTMIRIARIKEELKYLD